MYLSSSVDHVLHYMFMNNHNHLNSLVQVYSMYIHTLYVPGGHFTCAAYSLGVSWTGACMEGLSGRVVIVLVGLSGRVVIVLVGAEW